MSSHWIRSEPKPLRPFFAATDLADVLDKASIELRRGDEPIVDESTVLDLAQMQDLDPILRPGLDVEHLEGVLGARARDYELVVTLRTPQMLRRSLVDRWHCAGPLPEAITFEPDLLADARATGSVEIGIAICLAHEVAGEDGWPTSAGAWIARKTFFLGLDRRQSSFSFDELTKEERRIRKLPERTAFVVDVDELNAVLSEDQPMAQVLVAPDLLEALRSGAIRSAAQAVLMAEILDALLDGKAKEIDPTEPVIEGSGLQRLLRWASDGTDSMPVAEFTEICRSSERRRALVQHRLDLAGNLEALR